MPTATWSSWNSWNGQTATKHESSKSLPRPRRHRQTARRPLRRLDDGHGATLGGGGGDTTASHSITSADPPGRQANLELVCLSVRSRAVTPSLDPRLVRRPPSSTAKQAEKGSLKWRPPPVHGGLDRPCCRPTMLAAVQVSVSVDDLTISCAWPAPVRCDCDCDCDWT
jgi:hypothetical protein